MRLEETQIEQIAEAFSRMQSRYDFFDLLNMVKPMVYGKETVPFSLKQLTYHANPSLGRPRYLQFNITKKSGSQRTIHAPVRGLKAIQRTLGVILQCVYQPHEAAMGFVWGRSIVDNARLHTGKRYVFNVDLKDFFPSVDQARVWKCLQLKPFNLFKESSNELRYSNWEDFKTEHSFEEKNVTYWREKDGGRKFAKTPAGEIHLARQYNNVDDRYVLKGIDRILSPNEEGTPASLWLVNRLPKTGRLEIVNMIASLCCTQLEVDRMNAAGEWERMVRKVLPQGAPTSPVVTNIVCQRLDHLLTGVSKRFGLRYTRYADDITFSSMHNVYQEDGEFRTELQRIIADQGFRLNEGKTRLQKDGHRKEVTGLLVNDKPNVQKRYVKQLRMWLYYWERYGELKAYEFFFKQYKKDRGHVKNGKPDMVNVISGKLDYLQMVKGSDDECFLMLKQRFKALIGKEIEQDESRIEESKKPTGGNKLLDKGEDFVFVNDPDEDVEPSAAKKRVEFNKVKTLEKAMTGLLRINGQKESSEFAIPQVHNPRGLVELLKKFSLNDSALKYATHSWDAGRDVDMFKDLGHFLEKVKEEYDRFSFDLNSLKRELNGKIYAFLLNKNVGYDGWGDRDPKKRIKFGWSSPELMEACMADLAMNPEDFILPEKFQVIRGGRTIQRFMHVIDVFKNEIEMRDENSALLNLIRAKHRALLYSFNSPVIDNLGNKTFYTDVSSLSKALELIFENIQKRSHHPDVAYTVRNKGNDAYVLEINHVDSFCKGKSIRDEKFQLRKGDFGLIADYLKNLCDWSVESGFEEGDYRINLLASDTETPPYEEIDKAEGFKYLLTFYK